MNEALLKNAGGASPSPTGAPERTPELIGAEIRMYVDAGRRVTLLCGIEIGRRLCEAKELLAHGEWLPWLSRETEFSDRTAQNYMRAFREYGADQMWLLGPETNTKTFADLPISKALALLSVPESEREAFAAEVGAEGLSTRELEQAIRERDEGMKRAKAAEEAQAEAAERETALQKQLDAALKKAEKAEKAAEKARKDAENAGEQGKAELAKAAQEAARARQEAEELRKELKLADPETAKFGVVFGDVQAGINRLSGMIAGMKHTDPEKAEKLSKAACALLGAALQELGGAE